MIIDAMKFCLQLKYEQSLEFRNELDIRGTERNVLLS